jgi:hypothetical protein
MQHVSTEIIKRMNTHLGSKTVKQIQFIQDQLPSSASSRTDLVPRCATDEAAEAAVRPLSPGPLWDALKSLASAVLAQSL